MAGYLQPIAFVSMPGGGEWIVILFIALLIFGRRLPEVARSLGKTLNEFKRGMREFQDSANEVVSDVNKVTSDAVSDTEEGTTMYGAESEGDAYYGESDSTYEVQDTTDVSGSDSEPAATSDSDPMDSEPPTQDAALGTPSQAADSEPPDTKRPDAPDSYEPMS